MTPSSWRLRERLQRTIASTIPSSQSWKPPSDQVPRAPGPVGPGPVVGPNDLNDPNDENDGRNDGV